jgi:hypothetical protein
LDLTFFFRPFEKSRNGFFFMKMSLASWWDDDDLQHGTGKPEAEEGRHSTARLGACNQEKPALRPLCEREKEVCEEHALGSSSCRQCALIEASSRGPWWADGWGKHKEVFDEGIPGSLPHLVSPAACQAMIDPTHVESA